MFIARWHIDARFGHKQQALDYIETWTRDIGPRAGLNPADVETLSGSVGALEAAIEHNWRVKSLAELEQVWAKLATLEAHKTWDEALEPHIVSGTSHWQVFRVV